MSRISLSDVTIEFPIYGGNLSFRKAIFHQTVGGLIKNKEQRIPIVTALDSVCLSIDDGDRVGLIGHNGAGKSTLLRTIAGIYPPSAGRVQISGRVSPLFDMYLGLRAESTGYENIFIVGLFLGMPWNEIKKRVDEIVDFAELGDFAGLPVKSYSTGMQWRLAFSIATSIAPDILLLDEGFGAVDTAFSAKADQRISALIRRSAVVAIASHSESVIRRLCNKALILHHGKAVGVGDIDEMLAMYNAGVDAAEPLGRN